MADVIYQFIKGEGWVVKPPKELVFRTDKFGRVWGLYLTDQEPTDNDIWDSTIMIPQFEIPK